MTSSAKQPERQAPTLVVTPRLVAGTAIVLGLVPVLVINDWQLSAPVFFLGLAWLSIVMTGLWLWRAGLEAASEDVTGGDVGFEMATRRDELQQEKRALLKAIKEIDFDRQMGKMSDEDCDRLTRMYRKRAIEVIKALDTEESDEQSVEELIERELRARRAIDKATSKKSKKSKKSPTSTSRESNEEAQESDS